MFLKQECHFPPLYLCEQGQHRQNSLGGREISQEELKAVFGKLRAISLKPEHLNSAKRKIDSKLMCPGLASLEYEQQAASL